MSSQLKTRMLLTTLRNICKQIYFSLGVNKNCVAKCMKATDLHPKRLLNICCYIITLSNKLTSTSLSLMLPALLPTNYREVYNLCDISPNWKYKKQLLIMKGKFIFDKNYNVKRSLKMVLGSWHVLYNKCCIDWKRF